MRKLTALLLGIVCAFSLTACGETAVEAPQEKVFSTSDIQTIVDAGAFSEGL